MTKRKVIVNSVNELRSSRADAMRTRVRRLNRPIYVLIACEESGIECAAYKQLGCEAYHCDVLPRVRGIDKSAYINADVTPLLKSGPHRFITADGMHRQVPAWDLIVAHPPCTYLCRSSAVIMLKGGELNVPRFRKMIDARRFFQKCLDASANYVCVENPVPLEMASLPQASCYVDPSWYGDRFTKKTLYWLKNLPPLLPLITHPHPKSLFAASRGRYRSKTSPYLAAEQALQWLDTILTDYGY